MLHAPNTASMKLCVLVQECRNTEIRKVLSVNEDAVDAEKTD